jgi:hypothetical protein
MPSFRPEPIRPLLTICALTVLASLLVVSMAPAVQAAPALAPLFSTPTIDGTIGAGEYGSHVDGQNQQTSGGSTAFVTWDATNLYVAYAGANVNEGVVLYLDSNPVNPANGGTNANGSGGLLQEWLPGISHGRRQRWLERTDGGLWVLCRQRLQYP